MKRSLSKLKPRGTFIHDDWQVDDAGSFLASMWTSLCSNFKYALAAEKQLRKGSLTRNSAQVFTFRKKQEWADCLDKKKKGEMNIHS
ncbi:conserved hypothetical protein [Ricinus communis]|uniref:Uncharacterized protein n=1 Tax=Ricinus communis TaxID=3988 RepID=B9RXC9_RICCO|nr:conserved hypothetical protein [Ricinus communis]